MKEGWLGSAEFVRCLLGDRDLLDVSPAGLLALGKSALVEIESRLGAESERRSVVYRAHLTALRNWLKRYRVAETMSGGERARGFREAYYHLREVGALEQALGVMKVSIRVRKGIADEKWERFVSSSCESQEKAEG